MVSLFNQQFNNFLRYMAFSVRIKLIFNEKKESGKVVKWFWDTRKMKWLALYHSWLDLLIFY